MQLASGLLVHLVFAGILVWVVAPPTSLPSPAVRQKPLVLTTYVGLNGGGSGGDGKKAAAAARRHVMQPSVPQFRLPQMPQVLGALELPGPVVLAAAGLDQLGTREGAPDGKGEGADGPGAGTGRGPGNGPGEGPFADGTPGLTSPQVVFERKPEYTAEAMSARIQGAVLLEAIVLEDGRVTSVRVVKSMDPPFGLDKQAVEAVRAWRFRPGTYQGRPVPVRVFVELLFTLR